MKVNHIQLRLIIKWTIINLCEIQSTVYISLLLIPYLRFRVGHVQIEISELYSLYTVVINMFNRTPLISYDANYTKNPLENWSQLKSKAMLNFLVVLIWSQYCKQHRNRNILVDSAKVILQDIHDKMYVRN